MLSVSIAFNAITGHGTCTVVFVAVAAIVMGLCALVQTLEVLSVFGWIGVTSITVAGKFNYYLSSRYLGRGKFWNTELTSSNSFHFSYRCISRSAFRCTCRIYAQHSLDSRSNFCGSCECNSNCCLYVDIFFHKGKFSDGQFWTFFQQFLSVVFLVSSRSLQKCATLNNLPRLCFGVKGS